MFGRASGILLHPTSLPGRYGIGDLGSWAYRFVDLLHQYDQRLWQVLPLGPTSYGDSPYQALGAFAGNPLLVSLDRLAEQGWLDDEDLSDTEFPDDKVEYGNVIPYHFDRLNRAFQKFMTRADASVKADFNAWCAVNREWLDDFALFVALKNAHGGRPWVEWEPELVRRDAAALAAANGEQAEAIASIKFIQWQFFTQWGALKQYANERGIRLVGDAPIFVAHDSSDVWANPELFYLDEKGYPTVIAGVPPDYFSATGQRWGNPLYRWDVMAQDDYAWWIKRLRQTLATVDMVRIDHFRGFEAYWEIPASEPTAVVGRWVKGPGAAFFESVKRQLGDLPIIAEDLGVITPEVEALRTGFGLPGMKILQFAWGDVSGEARFLPHNHEPNCIVYSGTHDNNTSIGWLNEEATPAMRHHLNVYLDREAGDIQWEFIHMGEASAARIFLAPLQDVLGLDSWARMNLPGRESGNWGWRAAPEDFENAGMARLQHYTKIYGRALPPEKDENVES
ncbi:MAG: 4-alpha-glucanotransferase [Anaerolineae bacterium]